MDFNYTAISQQAAAAFGIPIEAYHIASLLALTFFILLYMLIAWKVINALQKRDIAVMDSRAAQGRFHRLRAALHGASFVLKYFILFPLYSALAFLLLAFTLLLTARSQGYEVIILISSSVIAATRVLAYYDDRISHEVIKLVPLTLLAILLLYPQNLLTFSFSLDLQSIDTELLLASAAFIITAEWLLRLAYTALILIRPKPAGK